MPIENLLKYLIIPVLTFTMTLGLTPLVMRCAVKLGMMDTPGVRRIHTRLVPRAGGLAVFASFHIGCAAIFLLPGNPFGGLITQASWLEILLITSILLVIGLWDDRFGMPAAVKLAGQAMVGSLSYVLGFHLGAFFGFGLPLWIDLPGTVFWFAAFINAFNLIDGMDGLATGLAAIAALGLAGVFLIGGQPGDCLVMLALLGACLGFLRYNFNPAQVFLGDTGSMFLGCTLAALALNTGSKTTTFTALAVPLLSVGIPMFDTFLAVWRRLARKFLKKDSRDGDVFGADIDHLHHRLLKTGFSQRRAAALLYCVSLVMVGVALLSLLFESRARGIYMIAFVSGVYIIIRHLAKIEMWTTGMALMQGIKQPRLKHLSVPLYIVCDVLVLAAANLAVQLLLDHVPVTREALRTVLIEKTLLQVGIPFLCLALGGRVYQRIWHMATTIDYTALVVWAVIGILLSSGVTLALGIDPHPAETLYATVLYIGLALVPLLGLHSFMRLVVDWLGTVRLPGKSADARTSVLVFGATHHGKLFLRDQKAHCLRSGAHLLVKGFFDQDTNLHGRLIHGIRVFGGLEQLEEAIKKTSARMVVVTEEMSGNDWMELRQITRRAGIAVSIWEPVLRDMSSSDLAENLRLSELEKWQASTVVQGHADPKADQQWTPTGAPAVETSFLSNHAVRYLFKF